MNLASFDLNLLKVLDALLVEQSTVRAATRVGLSQPAVSAALGRLRAALNDPLFVRVGAGLEPTDFARTLAPQLQSILGQLTEALTVQPFDPASATRSFRISGSDFFTELLMPALADRLSRVAPGVRVQQVDITPDVTIDPLLDPGLDFALVPRYPFPPWAEDQIVMRSGFVVIARQGNPRLARAGIMPGDTIPIDLFCDMSHVLFSPEGHQKGLGDTALDRVGRSRHIAMTLPVMSGVWRTVSESDLLALLPHQLAARVCEKAGLDTYVAPMKVPVVDLSLVWHKRSSHSPAHRWMRGEIASVLRAVDASGG